VASLSRTSGRRDEVIGVSTELKIELFEPDADPETVDELTRNLRNELLDLDVDSITQPVLGPAPEGSKGLELMAIGALLVQVKNSIPVVTSVVSAIRSWLQRGSSPGRSLKVTVEGRTLELTAATAEQQQRIVD
jgi:hypothetical protein